MKYHIVTILLTLLVVCACSSRYCKIKRITSTPISFPESFVRIEAGRDDCLPPCISQKAKLIIGIDSLQCAICRIHKLSRYSELSHSLKDSVQLIILISPRKEDRKTIIHEISSMYYDFPVYIDLNNRFYYDNPSIPKDNKYHCFLTNTKNVPVFIGDPTQNERLSDLFKQRLKLEHSSIGSLTHHSSTITIQNSVSLDTKTKE